MIKTAIPLLHVSNLLAAEEFYCKQLGFKKIFHYQPSGDTEPGYIGVTRDGVRLHLSSFRDDGKAGNAVVLIVDNIDDLYEEFRSRGVSVDLPPTDQTWGNREMYIKDEDQNSIRFTQWPDGAI